MKLAHTMREHNSIETNDNDQGGPISYHGYSALNLVTAIFFVFHDELMSPMCRSVKILAKFDVPTNTSLSNWPAFFDRVESSRPAGILCKDIYTLTSTAEKERVQWTCKRRKKQLGFSNCQNHNPQKRRYRQRFISAEYLRCFSLVTTLARYYQGTHRPFEALTTFREHSCCWI